MIPSKCRSNGNRLLFILILMSILLFQIYTCFELPTLWNIIVEGISIAVILITFAYGIHYFRSFNFIMSQTQNVIYSIGFVSILSVLPLIFYHLFIIEKNTPTTRSIVFQWCCFAMILILSIVSCLFLSEIWIIPGILSVLLTLGTLYFMIENKSSIAIASQIGILIFILIIITIFTSKIVQGLNNTSRTTPLLSFPWMCKQKLQQSKSKQQQQQQQQRQQQRQQQQRQSLIPSS